MVITKPSLRKRVLTGYFIIKADHKTLSVWKNLGKCRAVKHGSTCGPGLQSQVRNCTNGTEETCADEELERNISCFYAGTSLPDCASKIRFRPKVKYNCAL